MLLGEFIPTSNCPHCEKKNSSVVSFLSVLLSITLGLITPPPERLMHHLILVIFSLCRYKQTINKSLFHYYFHSPSICWWAAGLFWLLWKTTPTFQLAKLQGLVIRWNFLKLPIFIHIASSKAFVLKSLAHKGCKWWDAKTLLPFYRRMEHAQWSKRYRAIHKQVSNACYSSLIKCWFLVYLKGSETSVTFIEQFAWTNM